MNPSPADQPETLPVPREILEGLVAILDRRGDNRKGSPNHGHQVPGIWDSDNGVLAGKPCAECAIYDAARELTGRGLL